MANQFKSGHRKITAAAATFAAGEVVGKDLLIWLWDVLFVQGLEIAQPMPEAVALEIIALLTLGAFYITREERVDDALLLDRPLDIPADPPRKPSRPAASPVLAGLVALLLTLTLIGCVPWDQIAPKGVNPGHSEGITPPAAEEREDD